MRVKNTHTRSTYTDQRANGSMMLTLWYTTVAAAMAATTAHRQLHHLYTHLIDDFAI